MIGAEPQRIYRNMIFDSTRWAAYTPRDGDIIVCTSYKAGTTWTQMICALLVHQTPDLPKPLAEISPWLDIRVAAIRDVIDDLDGQPHRRILKTHTPLDGLPYYDNVSYVMCGRDPRDVFMSLQNHLTNADPVRFVSLLIEQGVDLQMPAPLPEDLNQRFAVWMTEGTFEGEADGRPYWSHFRHAQTFWNERQRPNLHLIHYSDLKADLESEMRRVAGMLGLQVAEALWPALVKAATFAEMKANADRTAPDTNHAIWKSNSQFFNSGENAQWRGALNDESVALYAEKSRARYPSDLLDWLENGRAGRDPAA